jgi:uncharacterized membrane protein YeaQ/YmgE (transglycosylase-associated protein family)
MGSDFFTTMDQILRLLGVLLRPFGAIAIGVFVGWISKNILTDATKAWQLQIAVFLGLVGAMVTMPMFAGAGDVGAFTLGVGLGALIPAIMARRVAKPAK